MILVFFPILECYIPLHCSQCKLYFLQIPTTLRINHHEAVYRECHTSTQHILLFPSLFRIKD